MGRMSIDEVIDEMLRAAEVNGIMAERCRYGNNMQPSYYDVEAGVQYSKDAEKYRQIAKWLEELKIRRKSYEQLIGRSALNNSYKQGYKKAIEDCAGVMSEFLDCRGCQIDCREYNAKCCKDAIKVYLQDHLKGGKEDAGKP